MNDYEDSDLFSSILNSIIFGALVLFLFGHAYNSLRLLGTGEFADCTVTGCSEHRRERPEDITIYYTYSFDCTDIKITSTRKECIRHFNYDCILFVSEKLGEAVFVGKKNGFLAIWSYNRLGGLAAFCLFIVIIVIMIIYGLTKLIPEVKIVWQGYISNESAGIIVRMKKISDVILLISASLIAVSAPLLVGKVAISLEGRSIMLNGLLMLIIISSISFGPFLILFLFNQFKRNISYHVKIARNIITIIASSRFLYSILVILYRSVYKDLEIGSFSELLLILFEVLTES